MVRKAVLLVSSAALVMLFGSGIALAGGTTILIDCTAGVVCEGTSGDDSIKGTPEADKINGLAGRDLIQGRGKADKINGGPGDDGLDGDNGADSYVFKDGWGSDTISGDEGGRDTLNFSAVTSGVMVDPIMFESAFDGSNSVTWSGVAIENFKGSKGDDFIMGDSANNKIWGNGGNDDLFGDDGDDTIDARDSAGDDSVSCGGGTDDIAYVDRVDWGNGSYWEDEVDDSCETIHVNVVGGF